MSDSLSTMQVVYFPDAPRPKWQYPVVALGNFDGVHRGHARIVERLLVRAKEVGGPAIVFTFDPHPVRLLRPEHAPPPLTWTDRKGELLEQLGVDAPEVTPEKRFVEDLGADSLDLTELVMNLEEKFGEEITEEQAASLEQTSASMEEMSATVQAKEVNRQTPAASKIPITRKNATVTP